MFVTLLMTTHFIIVEKLLKMLKKITTRSKNRVKVVQEQSNDGKSAKFQYVLLVKHKPLKIEIEGFQLQSAKPVKLLEITIDHNLTFDTHISNICKTPGAKVKSLSRIRNALDEKQAKLL